MKINELYNGFNSMYNTHQAGFYRPVADFIPAVNAISMEIFHALGKQEAKTQVGEDLLSPFSKTENLAVVDMDNAKVGVKPADYQYYKGAGLIMEDSRICGDPECVVSERGQCLPEELMEDFYPKESNFSRFPVSLIKANKWSSVTTHVTKGPDLAKRRVYIKQTPVGFEVLPKEIGVIVLDYYRLPVAAKFNYTERVDGPDVYLDFQESGSVHLEWSDVLIPVFLKRLGGYYGLTTKDPLILQASAMEKSLQL